MTFGSDRPSGGSVDAAILVGGALALAALTVKGRGRLLDDRLFKWFNSSLQRPALDWFFRGITELGSLWASIGAAGAMVIGSRRREASDALAAATVTWVAGQGLKRAWRRMRPYDAGGPLRLLILKPRGASWPSSHPMVLLAFVTVASRDLKLAPAARAVVAALAGLVGCSRVYLGVHYPADVAGGLLMGRAIANAWSRSVSPRMVG